MVRSEEAEDDAGRAIEVMSRPGDDAVGSDSCSMDCSSDDDSRRTQRQSMARTGKPVDLAAHSEIWMRSDW